MIVPWVSISMLVMLACRYSYRRSCRTSSYRHEKSQCFLLAETTCAEELFHEQLTHTLRVMNPN